MLPIIPILIGVAGIASRVVGAGKTLVNKVSAPATAAKVAVEALKPKTKFGRSMSKIIYVVCVLMLSWEILGRQVLIPILCPELLLQLPPSMLDTVLELLLTVSAE